MNRRIAVAFFLVSSVVLVAAGVWAGEALRPMAKPFPDTGFLESGPVGHQARFPMLTAVGDAVDFGDALIAGADYLQAMQADVTDDNAGNGTDGVDETPDDPDDAGWDWVVTSPLFHHTTAASPTNIYGETANGLLGAYLKTGDVGYFTAMTDCADEIKTSRITYRTGSDVIFLLDYNDLTGVSSTEYADSAKAKFDGRMDAYGHAGKFARYIRDVRAGQGYENGIIPWDIGIWARAAAMLADEYPSDPFDYAAAADTIAEVLWQDTFNDNPGYFDLDEDDGWDPDYGDLDYYWYNLGLCGLIDAFNASGLHTSEISGLVTRLLAGQYVSGAISYCYGANEDDEDWQSTAYAAMTLGRLDKATYQSEINMMGYYLGATQDASGGWVYSSGNHYPQVGGEMTGGIYYTTDFIPNGIAVDPASVACLSADEPCDEVEVLFSREDTTPVRGYSVTFELSSELELCDVMSASITEDTYLSGVGTTYFYITDNGGGSYTVDCAIAGLPCGATGDGVLFTIDVQGSGGDGTGTITVTSVTVRDCSNAPVVAFPGAPVDVTIDHTAPTAIADVAASQVKSGNDTDGTTAITLSFTAPGDAAEVEVYRAPYGDYPEYDDGTGSEPGAPGSYPPGSPWVLTSVTATGQTDEPSSRDFWYYVVYTKDACGNVSAVSNKTTGTLNYHLGDVTDGTTPGAGDNWVGTNDISLLGSNYWKTLIHNDPVNYLDVGPTTDYSVDALPTTDNEIQFEDLMMFAINFNQVSLLASPGPQVRVMEHPGLALEIESGLTDVVRARLVLTGNRESVKGLHAAISYGEGLEFVGLSRGGLWKDQSGPVFFEHRAVGGQLEVDGVVMGTSSTLQGSGVVCEVSFRVVGAVEAMPHLVVADLRDLANRRLERKAEPRQIGVESEPLLSQELRQVEFSARPNPFSGSTELRFAVPSGGRVSVKIYDAGGRLVRTLVDEEVGAGRYRAVWEGQGVSPGVYMAILETGREREVRKVTLLP
jgi:hypothetical protein